MLSLNFDSFIIIFNLINVFYNIIFVKYIISASVPNVARSILRGSP